MQKQLKNISYKYEKKTVLNLWKMLYILQDIYKVNFWDYYNSDSDFDNWCNLKGYGKKDPKGLERQASNIWFKEFQSDVEKGIWKKVPYCCFIDMFLYDIEDLGNDESDKIYHVDFKNMLERANEEDISQFGKPDYRVHLTDILIKEVGNSVYVDQSPE